MINKTISFMKWLLSRTATLYVAVILLIILCLDLKAVSRRIELRLLNTRRPDISQMVLYYKGDISSDKVKWHALVKYYAMVVKYIPAETGGRFFLGLFQHEIGDHERAWKNIQDSAENSPYLFWNLYDAGILAFSKGDSGLAIRYLSAGLGLPTDKILDAQRDSTAYLQIMALSTFNMNEKESILKGKENVRLLLAAQYYYLNDFNTAKSVALEAISQLQYADPEPFFFYAGAASLGAGDFGDAVKYITKCVNLKSENPFVYTNAGEIMKASGKTAEAENFFRTAERLKKSNPAAFPYQKLLTLRLF